MKLQFLILSGFSLLLSSPALNAVCQPVHNQSRSICEENAETKKNACIEHAKSEIENMETGPDTYQQRNYYSDQIHGGCNSTKEDDVRQCRRDCHNP